MSTQAELDKTYMIVAEAHAELSKAERTKVGACLVTPTGVILGGVNGMAPSGSNRLEYVGEGGTLVTKVETIHAELNCLLKSAKEGVSVVGCTLYTTLSCCLPCSEMVAAAGVKRVVYRDEYRCSKGLDNLRNLGVEVCKYENCS